MSDASDDSQPREAAEEAAAVVSTTLTQQMLHLANRYHEERFKLEERTFHASPGDDGVEGQDGDDDCDGG
ncbi:MAG: hypothetical protein J7521_21675 [Caulobacter sp.]|nr:hypothetical protein [Caulobacter sp.]